MAKNSQVYIEAYGCSASFSDFELTAGQLQNLGYEIVEDPKFSEIEHLFSQNDPNVEKYFFCSILASLCNYPAHNSFTQN